MNNEIASDLSTAIRGVLSLVSGLKSIIDHQQKRLDLHEKLLLHLAGQQDEPEQKPNREAIEKAAREIAELEKLFRQEPPEGGAA